MRRNSHALFGKAEGLCGGASLRVCDRGRRAVSLCAQRRGKAHGYEALLPYLCQTDHFLAELLHARLIRTQTEALGGGCCDYWYIGDRSPALEQYKDLKRI